MSEPTIENFDEEDVAAALRRKTSDGYGTDVIPESDFTGFATDWVEKENDQ